MSASEVVGQPLESPMDDVPVEVVAAGRLERLERMLGRASDWLNPILVKESRQAMKSRQFSVTFTLLLVSALGWSIIGITLMMPAVYYAPGGVFMLTGYYFILATAVLIVVPFMAYRSLVSELEDGTYELLSITSLSARHLVTGKLGSAIVQMLVYYSAIAPCVAFTYLLRGVSIFTLVLVLAATFINSVMLCVVGLVLASVTRNRHWQLLLSVVFLGGLAAAYFFWSMAVVGGIITEGIPIQAPEFWIVIWVYVSAYASYFVVFILAAEALNNFPSENRSTKIRMATLAQTALFVMWIFYGIARFGMEDEVLMAMLIVALGHWWFYGTLMTGELPQLSPRVKRRLPTTLLGRTFLTLFNPGSATGYAFAVACFTAVVLSTVAAVLLSPNQLSASNASRVLQFALLSWGYLTAYLGVGRLLLIPLRQLVPQGSAIVVLVHVLLLLAGAGIPILLEAYMNNFRPVEYSALQMTNWMWTLEETIDAGLDLHPLVLLVVPLSGLLLLLINLMQGAPEFRYTRHALPERVKVDDQQNVGTLAVK